VATGTSGYCRYHEVL